jgi:hypothetical protein
MNILRRLLPATKTGAKEIEPAAVVRQLIGVTVEREWVSMLVRGRNPESADGTTGGAGVPEPEQQEMPPQELPAPVQEKNGRNRS